MKEETRAVTKIGGVRRIGDVAGDEWREMNGGDWIVEDVFTDDEIGGVDKERSFHVEGWPAESHYTKG